DLARAARPRTARASSPSSMASGATKLSPSNGRSCSSTRARSTRHAARGVSWAAAKTWSGGSGSRTAAAGSRGREACVWQGRPLGARRNPQRYSEGPFSMAVTRTFSIIKPDATRRNLTGAVTKMLEDAGLRVVASKRIHMTREQAEGFYAVHRERPFFGELVEFMISGPVVVQVLEGEDAVKRNREVMGATNPADAAEGTIRKTFAESIEANSVHGSDSDENAKIEIEYFFKPEEIVG